MKGKANTFDELREAAKAAITPNDCIKITSIKSISDCIHYTPGAESFDCDGPGRGYCKYRDQSKCDAYERQEEISLDDTNQSKNKIDKNRFMDYLNQKLHEWNVEKQAAEAHIDCINKKIEELKEALAPAMRRRDNAHLVLAVFQEMAAAYSAVAEGASEE